MAQTGAERSQAFRDRDPERAKAAGRRANAKVKERKLKKIRPKWGPVV